MTEQLFVVQLVGLPLDVHRRADEHSATLQRELALVHAADANGTAPARLLWLSQHLNQRFSPFVENPEAALQQALAGDGRTIDLQYEVPADAAEAAEALGAALDEVDDFCRSGDLLTLVTPAESLEYRRWLLGEFSAQIRGGAAPTPWSEYAERAGVAAAADDAGTDAAAVARVGEGPGESRTIAIEGDLDLEGAAAIRGTIAQVIDDGVTHLRVDLQRCAFIDSVGISLLLTTRQRLVHAGGSLVVVNSHDLTQRTLQTTGVYDELTAGP